MKKVLFASTALVLTAGVASAEITLSGSASMGLQYDGTTTTVNNEIDFNIVGTGETDGGVAFGASIDLDASGSNSTEQADETARDPEVFVSYNGLKLTVGNIGEATDVGLSDIGYSGIGIDDVAEEPVGTSSGLGSHDVRVDYSFGDYAVVASVDSSNDDWAVGFGGSFDAFSFNLSGGQTGTNDVINVVVGYDAGAFDIDAMYRESGGGESFGIRGAYTTGDITVSAMYAEDETGDAWGLGVDYDLGGATLAGGFGQVAGTDVADLGISFSF